MRKPAASTTKHSTHRSRQRAKAIDALGGRCVECGYSDNILALDLAHVPELECGAKGMYRNTDTGLKLCRRIIEGDHTGILLLCANCRSIRTRSIPDIHRNVLPPSPPPAAHATGRDRQ